MDLPIRGALLRRFRAGDEPSIARNANSPAVARNVRDQFPHPYTLAHAEAWVAFASTQEPQNAWAIDVGGEVAGGIGVLPQDDIYRRSLEVGYWLGEAFWGQGIMTAALAALSGHLFATRDVCRLFARVFEGNAGSVRVLEKAGFTLEARMRKAAVKNGTVMDQLLYALVVEEP